MKKEDYKMEERKEYKKNEKLQSGGAGADYELI